MTKRSDYEKEFKVDVSLSPAEAANEESALRWARNMGRCYRNQTRGEMRAHGIKEVGTTVYVGSWQGVRPVVEMLRADDPDEEME